MLLASLVLVVMVFLSGVVITANVIAEPEPHKFAHLDNPDLWTSKPKPVDASKQTYERVAPALPATPPQTAAAQPATAHSGPVVQAASAPADDGAVAAGIDATTTASVQPEQVIDPMEASPREPQPAPAVDTAKAQWCYARYRSYRVEDNSYQPYGGGARRQCEAPGGQGIANGSTANQNEAVAALREATPQKRRIEERQREDYSDQAEDVGYEEPVAYEEAEYADNASAVGAHLEWCFERYRSYRVEDNSYQPAGGGPRRECQSPHS
jgi:hypothetical protein